MIYLLDTNVFVRYLGRKDSKGKGRYESARRSDLATCAVVEAELRYGAEKSTNTALRVQAIDSTLGALPILPFDRAAAKEYAALRAHLERAGTPIGANDMTIASIALARGLALVTHNVAEFARVPSLVIEDWEA